MPEMLADWLEGYSRREVQGSDTRDTPHTSNSNDQRHFLARRLRATSKGWRLVPEARDVRRFRRLTLRARGAN
jgi:hypothetical protein